MKKGDKILCIKNRKFLKNYLNKKNNSYTILEINIDTNEIVVNVENNLYHINCHYIYQTKLKSDKKNFYVFEDYFITEKQYRKLKLQKLNGK